MHTYDDRPISMYDNLNMSPANSSSGNASTTAASLSPHKNRSHLTASSPAAANAATPSAAANSPYSDIQFQFARHNNAAQPLASAPLPNGRVPSQMHSSTANTPYYSTPFKMAKSSTNPLPISPTITTTAAPVPLSVTIHNNAIASNGNNNNNNNNNSYNTSSNYSFPQQRPLSQHSSSELNEACQSIAAVKAALNDAKSKFFGLNGYAADAVDSPKTHQGPAVATPKYQNIPENSVIFRQHQQQPPELPPKPAGSNSTTSPSTTPSPMSGRASSLEPCSYSSNMPLAASGSSDTPSTSKHSYKAIPLNDIDTAQPSQAVYMTTTVPQNIKVAKIAGRHTPTRNSLRHSRMLVVNNKSYQDVPRPNPLNFQHPTWARCMLILQVIIGLMLLLLSAWIIMLAPNTLIQDNPYWSGLAFLFSGILGLVLIRYQRIKRDKVRENCFVFLRADAYILALLALILCTIALTCATLHYIRLKANNTRCISTNILEEHGSCSCTFNISDANLTANMTSLTGEAENMAAIADDYSYVYEYRDLSCMELNGEWIYILGLNIILSIIGWIVSLVYIIFLACCRKRTTYSSVHTSTF